MNYTFVYLLDNSLDMAVHLSVCLSFRSSVRKSHGTTRLCLDRFSLNLILSIFRKSVKRIRVLLQSAKNNGYFAWKSEYSYDNRSLNSSWNEKYFM